MERTNTILSGRQTVSRHNEAGSRGGRDVEMKSSKGAVTPSYMYARQSAKGYPLFFKRELGRATPPLISERADPSNQLPGRSPLTPADPCPACAITRATFVLATPAARLFSTVCRLSRLRAASVAEGFAPLGRLSCSCSHRRSNADAQPCFRANKTPSHVRILPSPADT